jgi:lysophospholipase L1-like esterase
LDACGSTGAGHTITAFRWFVSSPTNKSLGVTTVATCRGRFTTAEEGPHRVELEVETSEGLRHRVQTVTVDDMLIVALGDSVASGEGNQDPGVLGSDAGPAGQFTDARCHRSRQAGVSRAAKQLETRSTHSSVTFINLACSGAQIDAGLLGPYDGKDPTVLQTAHGPLPAQLAAARSWVCGGATCPTGTRHVDAIFLSIGANDLGFADIVERCANPLLRDPPCHEDKELAAHIQDGIDQLGNGLRQLAGLMHGPFEGTDVYLTEYPEHLLDTPTGGEGCGALDLFWNGVDTNEAAWLASVGQRLNSTLHSAAIQLDGLGRHFHLVKGVPEAFAPHGYCASNSWFNHVTGSLFTQGSIDGAVHPNGKGHAALAKLILAAYDAPKPDRKLLGHVEVRFDQLQVADNLALGPNGESPATIAPPIVLVASTTEEGTPIRAGQVTLNHQNIPNGSTYALSPNSSTVRLPVYTSVVNGATTVQDLNVHATVCLPPQTMSLTINDGDLPGHGGQQLDPGGNNPVLRCLDVNMDHLRSHWFDAGTHTATTKLTTASLNLQYHVDFRSYLLDGGNETAPDPVLPTP